MRTTSTCIAQLIEKQVITLALQWISCIAYEWEYAVDLDGNAYSTLPDSIDPDKFSTMSWFTRQALYGKDDVAFYRLRN